jgi:hypothetical protein
VKSPAQTILEKVLLPTHLDTAGIRAQYAADARRRAFFTARCAEEDFLMPCREACAEFAEGRIGAGDFVKDMRDVLDKLGYDPEKGGWVDDGEPVSGLKNLYSEERLKLIANTQSRMAASVGRLDAETEGTRRAWPAWLLRRFGTRKASRAWQERWEAAADYVDWEGVAQDEMIALKSSPIWQALGDGAGGYEDTLENPYPPFAFNSGMDWEDVSREVCAELGLRDDNGGIIAPDLAPSEADWARAREKYGDEFVNGLEAALGDLDET